MKNGSYLPELDHDCGIQRWSNETSAMAVWNPPGIDPVDSLFASGTAEHFAGLQQHGSHYGGGTAGEQGARSGDPGWPRWQGCV